MAVTGSNFREDVKVDGTIDNNDVKAGKGDVGHNLPWVKRLRFSGNYIRARPALDAPICLASEDSP
jgi:hypothetical protein